MDANSRRATAMNMFDKSQKPPSHRRLAHQSWATSMYLLLDLLMGTKNTRAPKVEDVRVDVRGFSAGSFSALCLLHLLWRMPYAQASGTLGGIALPPILLHQIPREKGAQLMLFHLTTQPLGWIMVTDRIMEQKKGLYSAAALLSMNFP